jgi:hypothetical protein
MNGLRLLTAACLLWSSVAAGQAEPAQDVRAKASEHFGRGVELFQEEAYRAALVEFQRAYELAPDYRLLYNIAQAKLQVQDYLGAAQSYEGYLAEGGAAVPNDRRVAVEGELAALRERTARVSVTANRDGAEVYVDDSKVGMTPLPGTVAVNVGRHRITVRSADGISDARTIDVAGGDIADVVFELAAPTQAKLMAATTDEPSRPWTTSRKVALASWSVGGALLIGCAVTGVMAKSASDDLDAQLKTADVRRSSVEDQRDKVGTLALTTDVLLGVGIAAAATGTLLWLVGRPSEQQSASAAAPTTSAKLTAGLGTLRISGTF